MSATDLYDEDFYLWTQAQAEALRAEARRRGAVGGGSNELDWAHLAEEVGDLGARELRECFSRIRVIIEHLWKLETSAAEEPRRGWVETILTQRDDLIDALTPSIRNALEAQMEQAHERAHATVLKSLRLHEPAAQGQLDHARRWSMAQVLGEEDDPIG